MARRSREELITEFNRLYDVFATSRRIKQELVPDLFTEDTQPKREKMLRRVEEKKVTLSQLLSGFREAISDDFEMFQFGSAMQSEQEAQMSEYFLKRYSEITGRGYFDDAGRADKIAKKIIKRGRIKSHEEFRLLNMFVSDVDQEVFTTQEYETANRLMNEYETTAEPEL